MEMERTYSEKPRYRRCILMLLCALLAFRVSYAQELAGKHISIHMDDAPLEEILNEVKNLTGCKVFYNSGLLKDLRVSVNVTDGTVDDVLKRSFIGTGLSWKWEGNTLVIRRGDHGATPSSQRVVQGLVMDESGEPLAGVCVRNTEAEAVTMTDAHGRFLIKIPTTASTLEFSFIGMKNKALELTAKSDYSVVLQDDNVLLPEVVATGYQTISRERATGAYDIIGREEIEKKHATNFSTILDGLVAGAQSADDGRGGKLYTIRGTGTMLADNSPLVVLDGFPLMDIGGTAIDSNPALSALEKINPDDVESVTVLKDAAAASIWGARSANGVIVITTKKGNSRKALDVQVSSQLSIAEKTDVRHLMNKASSGDMIRYQRMAFDNGWITAEPYGTIDELFQAQTLSETLLYKGLRWGSISEADMNRELDRLSRLENYGQIEKYMLRTPVTFQTNASVSGGTGFWDTHTSIMYRNSIGDFIGKRDNAFFINTTNQFRISKNISFHLGLNFQRSNSHASAVTANDLRNLSPYEMLLEPDGKYASQVGFINPNAFALYDTAALPYGNMDYNVLREARTRKQSTVNTAYRVQAGLEVRLLDSLHFNSRFQYERNEYERTTTHDEESFFTQYQINYYTPCDFDGNVVGNPALPKGNIVQRGDGYSSGIVFRNDFSFDKVFGDRHSISAVIGNELSDYRTRSYSLPYLYGCGDGNPGSEAPSGFYGTMDGYSSSLLGALQEGGRYLTETRNNNRYVSFYGNTSYMYDERYGLSASARSDASNLITSEPKYRWSPLWSVGVMWNVGNESFFKNLSLLDRLTLRITYGQNGNACTASSAKTTVNTNSSSPDESTGLYPGTISDYGNPTLRWEKTATTNFGLDFALLNNHIYGSVDIYRKSGSDILGSVPIASANGTSYATFNNAKVRNDGIEASLSGFMNIGNVRISGNIAYAYNKNRITSLYSELRTPSDIINAYYVEGYPMAPIFSFEYLGMDDGIPCVSDGQGGKIPFTDPTLLYGTDTGALKYMGSRVSPHMLGVTLNVNYSGWMLSTLFNGRFGGKFQMPTFNYPELNKYSKMNVSAQLLEVLNGDPSCPPLPGPGISAEQYMYWGVYHNYLDTRVEDASYVYCKEISLNYDFTRSALNRMGIKGLSVFGKVENLGLLWSANSRHYHPDYLPGNISAPSIVYTMGVQVGF